MTSHRLVPRAPIGGAVATAFVLALCGADARADVIMPAPDDCPEGTEGSSSHCGPKCVRVACDLNEACGDDATCGELSLCVEARSCWTNGGQYEDTTIVGTCSEGSPCAAGTCEAVTTCIPTDAPGTDETQVIEQGCGCSAPGRSPHGAVLLAAGLVALGAAATRTRRPRK